MKSARLIACVALGLAATVQAEEIDLSNRSRASAAKASEPTASLAPFASRQEALQSFSLRAPAAAAAAERGIPCADGLRTLCYEMRDRGVLYRGARDFMPRVQGLTADGVALRHDRVILRYTFR